MCLHNSTLCWLTSALLLSALCPLLSALCPVFFALCPLLAFCLFARQLHRFAVLKTVKCFADKYRASVAGLGAFKDNCKLNLFVCIAMNGVGLGQNMGLHTLADTFRSRNRSKSKHV